MSTSPYLGSSIGAIAAVWFPVYGHPLFEVTRSVGRSEPWYMEHPDGLVTSGAGNPVDAFGQACFEARDDLVFPIGEPDPWFVRSGSFVYTADAHPAPTVAPWFQTQVVSGPRPPLRPAQ